MTEQEREELIEKMAKAAWESDGAGCRWEIVVQESVRNEWLREARAALDVAEPVIREQCAKKCEGDFDSEMKGYGAYFAAAIREGGKDG